MTYCDEILKILWYKALNYPVMRGVFFEIPKLKDKKTSAFYSTVHRLRKQGYIKESSEKYSITTKGRRYVEKRLSRLHTFETTVTSSQKNLLVLFDIPESRKAEREWFRWHLKKFNYSMVQKSVWVGPSPLPREFVRYVKSIGLSDSIKTFKLAKDYTLK